MAPAGVASPSRAETGRGLAAPPGMGGGSAVTPGIGGGRWAVRVPDRTEGSAAFWLGEMLSDSPTFFVIRSPGRALRMACPRGFSA